jgi:hypothetical protein
MKLAQNVAAVSHLSAEELGSWSRVFKDVATAFENVGHKEEAKQLKEYARGFNIVAGKRGEER